MARRLLHFSDWSGDKELSSMKSNKLRVSVALIAFLVAFASTPPARAFSEVSFEFFHSSLASHGSWHMSASFGQVWQPYEEVEHWHPYAYGHWVYTDFGWTWVSDYAWGAIPFHYGTWVIEPGFGWVWVPGYVWAPAWVVYRTGPSYIGWAPVPPRYSVGVSFHFDNYYEPDYFVFVPDRHFCDRRIDRWAYPASRRSVIYNQTTIINNNITIDNDVVVNRGLDYRRVERVAARRPERMRIDDVPRVAPIERVSRQALRDNPREALRVDPRHAERGRVRVVNEEVSQDARSREERRRDQAVEPERDRRAKRAPDQAIRREREEGQPAASDDQERVQRDRERAVEQDRQQRGREEERAQRDERARERQDAEQQDRQERARAAQVEQERAAEEREQAERRQQERAMRNQEQQQHRDQEREMREQQRRDQERAARAQEQQARREQEQQMRQEQERAMREQQQAQERAMREQQQAQEQERAMREQQRQQQEHRGSQERARQRRSQDQAEPETAPDDQENGRGHGRDW
jgi:hypothetical protein